VDPETIRIVGRMEVRSTKTYVRGFEQVILHHLADQTPRRISRGRGERHLFARSNPTSNGLLHQRSQVARPRIAVGRKPAPVVSVELSCNNLLHVGVLTRTFYVFASLAPLSLVRQAEECVVFLVLQIMCKHLHFLRRCAVRLIQNTATSVHISTGKTRFYSLWRQQTPNVLAKDGLGISHERR